MWKRYHDWSDASSDEEEEQKRRKINRAATPPKCTSSTAARGVGAGGAVEGIKSKSRSTESLWAELRQVQQHEMTTVQRQRAELEQEKAAMNTLAPDTSDIVAIGLGGEGTIEVHRDTICLPAPGSRFAALFSGRWEGHVVKDAEGRIFFDHDPELIRLIVNYLRIKRIDDPSKPKVNPPTAPEAKRQEWFCLLEHYGLTPFFTKSFSPLDVARITVVYNGSLVSTHRVGDSLQLTREGSSSACKFVACTPCLVPGTQSSWKVTINKLQTNGRLFLGLIGKTSAVGNSYIHPTSFGWASFNSVFVAGANQGRIGGWTGFTEGECLHFGLVGAKLTLFSVTKNRRFVMDNVPAGNKFIHLNFSYVGTTVTLEPLDADEYAKLMAV